MARKKSSVPLFELMSRSRELVPDRRCGAQIQTPPQEALESEEDQAKMSSAPASRPVPGPQPRPVEAPQAPKRFAPSPEPMVRTGDGRIRLSLNYVSSTVVLAGLLLLLIGSFVLGRKTASPSLQAGMRDLYTQIGRREAGSYLVLAELPGKGLAVKAQADKLDKYLYENGVLAEVEFDAPNRFVLVSYQPFEDSNSQQALEYQQKVTKLVSEAPVESAIALPSSAPGSPGPWWITLTAE